MSDIIDEKEETKLAIELSDEDIDIMYQTWLEKQKLKETKNERDAK